MSESQSRIYAPWALERWFARLIASPSSHVLTKQDLVAPEVQLEIANIGQFAEVAHGCADPSFVFSHLSQLVRPTFPLEGYHALEGSVLVAMFRGEVADLQAYIAHRPATRQLVVAFSGSSSPSQALHGLDIRLQIYPGSYDVGEGKTPPKVHAGFWRLFLGLRQLVLDELEKSLEMLQIEEIVITGHSLGAVQSSLLAMELLQLPSVDKSSFHLPPGLSFKLVTFGSPRVGNIALVELFRELVSNYREKNGEDSFASYSIHGYNDVAHSVPPEALGYKHLSLSPFYFFRDGLYLVPPSEGEYSTFPVEIDENIVPPKFPLGGHNYYNDRDMGKFLRQFGWLDLRRAGEIGWEDRYLRRLAELE
ncbi:hypothetical protein M0805_004291 [Coniferiporia weirii]|nr:hypothetical protein M0805_004291 [Coniferiporia weirii]